MSSLLLSSKKPESAPKATTLTDARDIRKRRRNRTTQSCLNCHTTKRMCDRQRPCSRCSQLGLSGICVYEVEGQQDELARLRKRVAELESVILELHTTFLASTPSSPSPTQTPCWLAEKHQPSTAWDKNQHRSPPSSEGPSTPGAHVRAFPSSSRTPGLPLSSQPARLFPSYKVDSSESPSSTDTDTDLAEHGMPIGKGGTCGCLTEGTCYNIVLELSIRLRKAADVLASSPSHSRHSACVLNKNISGVDALVKDYLLDGPRSIGSPTLGEGARKKFTSSTNYQYYLKDTTFS